MFPSLCECVGDCFGPRYFSAPSEKCLCPKKNNHLWFHTMTSKKTVRSYYCLSSRHSNSYFAHSFDFHCLTNFSKKYQFVVDSISLVQGNMLTCNLHLEEWSMSNNMVSKIWGRISASYIHLLQFKIQSHLQKHLLWIPVHQTSYHKKTFKISNITFAILPFFLIMIHHLEYFGVYFFWWNHQMPFKMFQSHKKNAKI